MTKERLIKRLKWYYPLEKFHAFFTIPLLLFYSLFSYPISDIIILIYGLLVCMIVLYQGQLYWKLKLQTLLGKKIDQEHFINFYKKSKKLNLILIGLMPVILLFQIIIQDWNFSLNSLFLWGLFANLFAVLEHINYYQLQLMIDNSYDVKYVIRNKRLKTASLAKDLNRNKI